MSKIMCIGEILIDFISCEKGVALKNAVQFSKMAGGAPANVAVACAKLGAKSVFLGKISNDAFGDFLMEQLENAEVDTSQVVRSSEGNTSLAFVSLNEQGNRDFSFYRQNAADTLYAPEDIHECCFEKGDILHFCSVNLIDAPVRKAHIKAIEFAKKNNVTVSFDLNVRKSLWNDLDDYRKTIFDFIKYADILKVSDEDMEFLLNTDDTGTIESFLRTLSDVPLIIYTSGSKPIQVFYNNELYVYDVFNVPVVDTTGAGDAFIGAFLFCLHKNYTSPTHIEIEQLNHFILFAKSAATITLSKYGAMSSLPTHEDVLAYIKKLENQSV